VEQDPNELAAPARNHPTAESPSDTTGETTNPPRIEEERDRDELTIPCHDVLLQDPVACDAADPAQAPAETPTSSDLSGRVGFSDGVAGLCGTNLKGLFGGTHAILHGIGAISDRLASALHCDSTLTPVVTGSVNRGALAQMTGHWLDAHGSAPSKLTPTAWLRLQETLLRWAIEVLSGETGLAAYLRTGLFQGALSTPSIVLDAGRDSRTIPAGLERVIRRRDRRCRFPGCDIPAELAQIHHLTEWDHGGTHRPDNLLILCSFHHLVAVHTWGWTITAHTDGAITATSPQGRTLHEPPGRPSSNAPPRAA
jgi:hypothetical protein